MNQTPDLLGELGWRGLLHQNTEGLEPYLSRGQVSGYAGFDPTASSLHVGSLVPVMGLLHLQRAGHRPVIVVGGGTGMIGDPSGKTVERQLLDQDAIARNVAGIRSQLERFLDFGGPNGAIVRDNADWLTSLDLIGFLRDIGKHFSINYMLAKESVKARMEGGISFTEFSYMLLQAYDFLELARRDGVTLQLGGSDQWGNITAGVELIRRVEGKEAHGLTLPLVTTSTGAKFGKTEAGSVWLDADRTSPYAFYQFWINTDDRDVLRYLKMFTLLSRESIDELERAVSERPEQREAQRALARDVTDRVHGAETARAAEAAAQTLFGAGDPRTLWAGVFELLQREIPFHRAGDGALTIVDALVVLGLAKSKGDARRTIDQGGVYVNGARVTPEVDLRALDRLAGGHLLIRKGARNYGLVEIGN
jgi:tyrosyl-tRNA synthetase